MDWLPALVLLALLEAGAPSDVDAEAPDAEAIRRASGYQPLIQLDLSLWSTYVYRGEAQYRSVSTPSFQPALTVAFPDLGPGTLGLEVWSAFSMSRVDYRPENGMGSEVDLSLRYDLSLLRGWLDLGVGFVYYIYPHAEAASGEKELLVEVGLGNLPVSLSLVTFTRLHPNQGIYLEPTLGWEQDIGQVTIGVDLSLAASVYASEAAILEHTTLGLSLTHSVGSMSLALSLAYSLRLAPGEGSFFERSLVYGSIGFAFDLLTPREVEGEQAGDDVSANP